MSASPPKDTDVEQGDRTPDNSGDMDRGDTEATQRDMAYNEHDVKEQDRWLPIANGWLFVHLYYSIISLPSGPVNDGSRRSCIRTLHPMWQS